MHTTFAYLRITERSPTEQSTNTIFDPELDYNAHENTEYLKDDVVLRVKPTSSQLQAMAGVKSSIHRYMFIRVRVHVGSYTLLLIIEQD